MKKGILIFITILIPLVLIGEDLKNNPFVKELTPKVKTKTTLKVYTIKTEKRKCAHPQKLTPKQANKIFHCIKIKGKLSVLVLTNEEIVKASKKFIEKMGKAKPDQMIVVEREKTYLDTKNKKELLKKIDRLTFWFKDNDSLVVFYSYKGYDKARILKQGFHVNYFKENGKTYKSAIVIKRDVWTKYLTKAIFEKDYERTWENIEKQLENEKNKKKENRVVKNQTQQTISIEEMQKELERIKDMLDKKLITEEEYNRLKKKILERAGL